MVEVHAEGETGEPIEDAAAEEHEAADQTGPDERSEEEGERGEDQHLVLDVTKQDEHDQADADESGGAGLGDPGAIAADPLVRQDHAEDQAIAVGVELRVEDLLEEGGVVDGEAAGVMKPDGGAQKTRSAQP